MLVHFVIHLIVFTAIGVHEPSASIKAPLYTTPNAPKCYIFIIYTAAGYSKTLDVPSPRESCFIMD